MFVQRKYEDLHEYQVKAVGYILRKKKCYLAVDLGLGKTIIVLTAIRELIDSGQIESAYIFAPLRVIQSVWKQEALAWDHTKELTFSTVHGDKETAFEQKADIYLMNFEGLLWLRNKQISSLPGEMLVIDEGSAIKDPTTERFKQIRRLTRNKDYAVVMSATPAPNSLLDLWSQYFVLDHGERLFTSFHKFRHTCFEQADYFGYSWKLRHGMDKLIYKRVGDITLRLDREDYLTLPGRLIIPTYVELPAKARKIYEQMEKEMFAQIDEETSIEAMNPAVVSGKCRQICQGAIYSDDGTASHIHDVKVKALEEIIDESGGAPILCAYSFRSEVPVLMKKWPDAVFINGDTKDVDPIKEAWNRKEIPLLFVQPQSVSHGLNLQMGGNIIVWLGLTWSSETWDQLIGRLDRQGQAELVRVFQIIARDTVNEVMVEVVDKKMKGQGKLLDALNDYRQKRNN